MAMRTPVRRFDYNIIIKQYLDVLVGILEDIIRRTIHRGNISMIFFIV